MNEEVELPAERRRHLLENALEILVRPHVAGAHERATHALREFAHILLDALALICECELRTARREPASDPPRDRAPVRHPENEAASAGEDLRSHGCASLLVWDVRYAPGLAPSPSRSRSLGGARLCGLRERRARARSALVRGGA